MITIRGGGTAEKGESGPEITFTGSGGTAPYTFTYKIDQGAEKTINSVGSSVVELEPSTATAGSFVYNLVRVSDSKWCSKSVTGQQVTVVITEESDPLARRLKLNKGHSITGDLAKPGETLHVYPIPARDQIVIRSSEVLGRVQLWDLQGRVVLEHEPSSSQEVKLSIADLPPGIYVLEVEEGQNLRRVKVSKE